MENIDLETRKLEYHNRALENADLIEAITTVKDGKHDPFVTRLFTSPSNELEIRYANAALDILCDVKDLALGASFDLFKEIPDDENIAIDWIAKLLKESDYGENDLKDKIFESINSSSAEEVSKVLYQGTLTIVKSLVDESSGASKRLYTLLGLNSDDKIDEIRLKAGLEKLVEGLSSIDVNNIEITGEQVESVEGFAANFHRVLEEGKKDPKEFSECMTIVKALTLDFGALPRKSDEE